MGKSGSLQILKSKMHFTPFKELELAVHVCCNMCVLQCTALLCMCTALHVCCNACMLQCTCAATHVCCKALCCKACALQCMCAAMYVHRNACALIIYVTVFLSVYFESNVVIESLQINFWPLITSLPDTA